MLDIRVATGTPGRTRVGAGQTIAVQAAGVPGSGLPATGMAAVSINLTATEYAAPGQTTGSRLQVLQPARILDTRSAGGAPIGNDATIDVQVAGVPGSGIPAAGVSAVVMNLTQAGNDRGGWMTVHPTGEVRQYTSSINFLPGDIDPNMVVAKVGAGGKVSIYNLQGNAHVVLDVLGYYTEAGGSGGRFVAIQPERVVDTRFDVGGFARTPIGPGQSIAPAVAGVPGSAVPPVGREGTTGVVANVTVAATTEGGYLTVHPTGEPRQETSTLNMVPNQVVPNLTIAKVGTGGRISVYNQQGQTHVIVDVVGYFTL